MLQEENEPFLAKTNEVNPEAAGFLSSKDKNALQERQSKLRKLLAFYGPVASTHSFWERLDASADEELRDMSKAHFIAYASIAMFATLGIIGGGIAVSFGALALGKMIALAALPLLLANSLFSLGKCIYDYFKTPTELRTPLHKFKLMTAPVSALLASAVVVAAALFILAVPGGLFILGGVAAVYGAFKLWQGYQSSMRRIKGREAVEHGMAIIEQKLLPPTSPKIITPSLEETSENVFKEIEQSNFEADASKALNENASLLISAHALNQGNEGIFNSQERLTQPVCPPSPRQI